MSSATNKQLVQGVFSELAKGNREPFGNAMAEDFLWRIVGTTSWSGIYRGKDEVREKLFRPLFAQFADRYTNTATRFLAEDDYVVVESRGRVTTNSGRPYNNEYCYIIRMADGKMQELTEYLDTDLVKSALNPPK